MQLNAKSITAVAVIVIVLIAGIYAMNGKQQEATAPAKTAGALAPGATMPAGHPPVSRGDQQGMPPGGEQGGQQGDLRTGKTVEDPKTKFTHFRVGNSNVKSIFIDGKEVWVGTSGGVIRYNTATDDFHFFDQKDGLLSKGVFNISKLDGRIVAGTYGGGMSLFDSASSRKLQRP
jgi:hypothetical protein